MKDEGIIHRFLQLAAALTCAAILTAPLLAATSHQVAAGILYLLFSPTCHQMTERCFALQGYPWAVCCRCAGIYFGIFVSSFVTCRRLRLFVQHSLYRRIWILAAAAPLLLDAVLLPLGGIWQNSASSRFATGLMLGGMLGPLVMTAIAEFVIEVRRTAAIHRCAEAGGCGT